MTRKMMAAVLAPCLLAGLTAGCGESKPAEPGAAVGETEPKPVTFTWLAGDMAEGPVKNDWEIFKEIEKKTGVKVVFQQVGVGGFNEKKQILIATNTATDFMQVTTQEARQQGPEKVFLNLKDYLDKAPNLKKFFEDNPQAKAQATGGDGGLYTVPILESTAGGKGFNYAWFARKDLTDSYNLKPPTTLDEFYSFLKELKQHNPDSYPLTSLAPATGLNGLYTVFLRSFTGIEGLINLNPDNDQYTFAGYHQGFKGFLQYLNKLYNEKLVDPEFPLLTRAQWEERLLTGKSSVTYSWKSDFDPLIKKARTAGSSRFDMDAIPQFASPGIKNYQFGRPEVGTNGISISANVKEKDAAVKFMDYLLGEEGRNYLSLGIPGKTYKLENGKPRYIEEFGSSPYVPLRRDWGVWFQTISLNNAVSRDAWERGLDDKFKAINAGYEKYILPYPKSFVKNQDELDLEKSKLNNLNKFLEQKITEFVSGKTPVTDESLNQFIDQAKKLGVDEIVTMYNTAYKRTYNIK